MGLNLDDPVCDATVFTKNRDRSLEAEVEFLARVVAHAPEQGWMWDEHFTVDGTPIWCLRTAENALSDA